MPAPVGTVNLSPATLTPVTLSGVTMHPPVMSPSPRLEGSGSANGVHVGPVGIGSAPTRPVDVRPIDVRPVTLPAVDVPSVDIEPVRFGTVQIGGVRLSGEPRARVGHRGRLMPAPALLTNVGMPSGPGWLVAGGNAVGCDIEHPVLLLPVGDVSSEQGWKSYAVDPGLEIKLATAREDGGDRAAQLVVMEEQGSIDWNPTRTYSLPSGTPGSGNASTNFYVPQGNEIRVLASTNALVHLNVCQKAPRAAALALEDVDRYASDFALSGH